MNEALRQLPARDVERMIRLEFFDEQEILTQLLDHYCLSWGSQGSCSDSVSLNATCKLLNPLLPPFFFLFWGGCNPKKPNATSNFKFGTGFFRFFLVSFGFFRFFSVFPFWPILTGLAGSC